MIPDKHLEYQVDTTLEHQSSSVEILLLKVKWLGYPKLDWRPFANLKTGSREILQMYHQKQGPLIN
jgi:hypothetical protein